MSKRQQNEKKPRIIELKKSDSSKLVTVHRMNIQIHPDRIEINAPEINENIEDATLTKYYYNEKGKFIPLTFDLDCYIFFVEHVLTSFCLCGNYN